MRGVLTRCRRLFLSNGNASPSCCAMLNSGCCRRQFAFFVAPAQLFAARTAAKQTEVVRTESWISGPFPAHLGVIKGEPERCVRSWR